LRTPISLMRTEAEIVLRRERDVDAYREALQHILAETERTSVLIEALLVLARADSGQEVFKLQPIELGKLLHDCMKEWKPLADRAGHELHWRSREAGEVWVMVDESLFRRVLMILLDNAVKYTPAPGCIDVLLEERDRRAVVSVNDTGIGISADEQSKIFDRFYRVDRARGRTAGGAGLGLSIARWVVEGHGGSITVESVANKGSRFSVQVPALSQSALP